MADAEKGSIKPKKCYTYAKNLASQPREFKIAGKWYKWNAMGTEGDTIDVTAIKDRIGNFARYFSIYEVEK